MQHCAGLIITYPSLIVSSIQSIIYNIIQIYLWTVSVICGKISALMYSYKLKLVAKKNQMRGRLHRANLRKVDLMCKHLNNKKNNYWHHFHRFVCGFTTFTTNMWLNTSIMMSGKFKFHHRIAKIVRERVREHVRCRRKKSR